jgi:hypothetical protein
MRQLLFLLMFMTLVGCSPDVKQEIDSGIDISSIHPQYWEFDGEPLILLGGSDEDNLFQIPDLEGQLDLLASVGGNYVRNTMSSRDTGNVWPFYLDEETGLYDLNRWNEEYWNRFSSLLKMTHEREIIVQVEVWATFDFYRENWDVNPFNPRNNMNYSAERTRLPEEVKTHPVYCDNPFFWSIPSHQNNMPLLEYQQRFVDKLLSHSLDFNNVLYCIDNETSVTSEWGAFWAGYISKKAAAKGRGVHLTEMWDPWDLDHISHRETFDHPEIYSFVEISQNNHQRGENQWNNGLYQIEKLSLAGNLRPVNNVKTYGNDFGRHGGGTQNGIQSFIRSALFGSAAVRFHRPSSGLGLSDTAQAVIHGVRMATDRIDFFNARPHNDLLTGRDENEAYCRAVPGREALVYFPDEGEVLLQLDGPVGGFSVERLNIFSGEWASMDPEEEGEKLKLRSPGKQYMYLIQKH